MSTIRYGIIGTANIANSTHIPCIQSMAGTEIVALCDLDPEALAKTQKRTGVPMAVRDYRELLALEEVDAVVVATPNDTHAEIVVEAFAQQCEPGYGTALQCGYCTPGFVMTARALLSENPTPTLEEVKEALSGNICRCGCYAGIAQAVLHASEKIRAKGGQP